MFLRQSTAVVIPFGPFLDKTDGVTLKTGMVSALDHASTGILLAKNGGTLTIRHATVTASTYDAHGCYKVTLDTTDTGTLGLVRVIYTDAATCLPVWRDFVVITQNEWDSMCAAAIRAANATQLAGQAITAAAGVTFPSSVASPTNITAGTITTATNLTNAPTVGDLTATMKTSVTTAASAATPAVTVSDKTGFSLSTAGILAIWHQLVSAIVTAGTVGKLLVDNITGDIFARIGAPAGASIAADVAAVKAQTASIQADTDDIQNTLVPAIAANVVLIKAKTDNLPASPAATGAQMDLVNSPNATAVTAIQSGLATGSALATVASYVDTEVAAIKAKTDLIPAAPAAVGDIPTANQNADALLDRADGIETGVTLRQAQRLELAVLAGKLDGAGSSTIHFRNPADSKNRVTATVDETGNRSAVTLDPS